MGQNGTVRYPSNGIRFYSVDLINKLVKELSWSRLFLQDRQDGIAADSSFMLVVRISSIVPSRGNQNRDTLTRLPHHRVY